MNRNHVPRLEVHSVGHQDLKGHLKAPVVDGAYPFSCAGFLMASKKAMGVRRSRALALGNLGCGSTVVRAVLPNAHIVVVDVWDEGGNQKMAESLLEQIKDGRYERAQEAEQADWTRL